MEQISGLPLVSIIVPVYKVEELLPQCVDSLCAQTFSNLEIILIDDGSPDRCGEICDRYAEQDSRIRVIHQENGGLSRARNAGIDAATGEYLFFVDSDDWIDPETIDYCFDLVKKYNTPMACIGNYDVDGETGEKTLGICPQKEEAVTAVEFVSRMFHWDGADSAACDKFFRRDLFQEIRFPVGVIHEDIPVMYRLVLKAGAVAMGNRPCYYYYQRPGSICNSGFSERDFDFPEHTFQIEADAQTNHPEFLGAARYLKTRAIGWTLQSLEIAGAATRKKFAEERRRYKALLKEQLPYIRSSDEFTRSQKRDYELMAYGLYRIPRMIYHMIRRG